MKSVITVLSVIFLSLSVNSWALNDDEALMLYFTFDEDEGGKVTDITGNNIEGSFEGAVWSKDGKIGGAVYLENNQQFVEVDAVPELDITDELTIQAWFFPEESQGDSNLMGRRSGANVGVIVSNGARSLRVRRKLRHGSTSVDGKALAINRRLNRH